LHPAFKSLDACLSPPFHSDSETHLTSCCKSHFLLIRFCFIYFDLLISHNNNEKDLLAR
jgi:hypothetical protein